MKKNVGNADRLLRLMIALIIITLYFMGNLIGMAGNLLFFIAIIILLTSMFSFCPIYALLGMNSIPKKNR
jgi:hypothetical protein